MDTNKTESGIKVFESIAAVQGELAGIGIAKNKRAGGQGAGYQFRGIDDVYNALAPLLAKHKLVIMPRVISRACVERQSKQGGALFYTVLEVEFDFISAIDGSRHTCRTIGEAMDSSDKSSNKAMSAAYKYAAFQVFCIPTEAEDADATIHEVSAKLSAPQIAEIERLANEHGAKLPKILAWAQAKSFAEVDADLYEAIVSGIKQTNAKKEVAA